MPSNYCPAGSFREVLARIELFDVSTVKDQGTAFVHDWVATRFQNDSESEIVTSATRIGGPVGLAKVVGRCATLSLIRGIRRASSLCSTVRFGKSWSGVTRADDCTENENRAEFVIDGVALLDEDRTRSVTVTVGPRIAVVASGAGGSPRPTAARVARSETTSANL
jgi:hypothetical protein